MTPADAARRLVASRTLHRLREAAGCEVYLLGGGLRDRLLGLPTHDLDVVVVDDPEPVARRIGAAFDGRPFLLGKPPFATWRVTARRQQIDISRMDTGLAEDILRRDFTVNALCWRLSRGPLVDLVGGLTDLAARRLCVVKAANLDDDPLRVLRAVRLMSTHPPFAMTSECESLVARAASGLAHVARERVVEEFHRLLAGRGAGKALAVAVRLGILAARSGAWKAFSAVPELSRRATVLADLQQHRSVLAQGAAMVAPALLAAPAAGFRERWDPRSARDALEEIGFPGRQAAHITRAAWIGDQIAGLAADDRAVRALAWEAGELLPACLAWAASIDHCWLQRYPKLRRWQQAFTRRRPLLDGREIATLLDLPEGAARAAAVRELRGAQARGDVRTRRQALCWLSVDSHRSR